MRKKLPSDKKRRILIGCKVDEKTKKQIDYIAEANGDTTSTYIFNLISDHIAQYTKMTRINWDDVTHISDPDACS